MDDVALLQIAVLQQDLLERDVEEARKRQRSRKARRSSLSCSTSAVLLMSLLPGKSSVQTENVFWGRSKIYVNNDRMVVWITSSIVTRLQFGTFRLHSSRDRAAIDSFRRHLKCIPAEFFSYWIRFRQHSRCIRGAFRLIQDALRTFGQDSKWLAISILPRMRSECVLSLIHISEPTRPY